MTTENPQNDVVIRRNDLGGISILLNGFDLAQHTDWWEIQPEDYSSGAPVLTVKIPCDRLDLQMEDR